MASINENFCMEVLIAYSKMYNEDFRTDEVSDWVYIYRCWLKRALNSAEELSLTEDQTYVGKKTQALLFVLGISSDVTYEEIIPVMIEKIIFYETL